MCLGCDPVHMQSGPQLPAPLFGHLTPLLRLNFHFQASGIILTQKQPPSPINHYTLCTISHQTTKVTAFSGGPLKGLIWTGTFYRSIGWDLHEYLIFPAYSLKHWDVSHEIRSVCMISPYLIYSAVHRDSARVKFTLGAPPMWRRFVEFAKMEMGAFLNEEDSGWV